MRPSNVPARMLLPVSHYHTSTRFETTEGRSNPCDEVESRAEKQILSYMSGIEALTENIQELDEAVQQAMVRAPKSCEPLTSSSTPRNTELSPAANVASNIDTTVLPTTQELVTLASSSEMPTEVSTLAPPSVSSVSQYSAPELPKAENSTMNSEASTTSEETTTVTEITTTESEVVRTTTESFTDPPIVEPNARRRRDDLYNHFGMPALNASSTTTQDQAGDVLAKASHDLDSLRKDLNTTAEWLKQTNHTIHSAMLRALQAYIASIQRRVDHQRNLVSKEGGLKSKVAVIKEKVAVLMTKLRNLAPINKPTGSVNRVDRGPDDMPVSSAARAVTISSPVNVASLMLGTNNAAPAI